MVFSGLSGFLPANKTDRHDISEILLKESGVKHNKTKTYYFIIVESPASRCIIFIIVDSPASRAGIKEGQILLTVNGVSVLEADHDSIISLVQQSMYQLSPL